MLFNLSFKQGCLTKLWKSANTTYSHWGHLVQTTDQVPVASADGAVAAAVDLPVVAPPAPADAVGDNNAQNANDNVVPAPQPAAPEISVSLDNLSFPSE